MKYVYFVSYAHEKGWGNIEITSNELLDNIKAIHSTQKVIEKCSNMGGIVIVNFQLLATNGE